MRSVGLGVMAALMLALAGACKQSSSPGAKPGDAPRSPALETAARLHWLGIKNLAADTNAAHFLSIWTLPETTRLENQTLDKLAAALASTLSPTNARPAAAVPRSPLAPAAAAAPPPPLLSASATLIRPLLTDLVEQEFYLEIGSITNQPGELVMAVRLGNERASAWETNLTAVFDSLLGAHSAGTNTGRVWTLSSTNHHAPVAAGAEPGSPLPTASDAESIHLERAGQWTVVGLARGSGGLLSNALARIERQGAPCAATTTNFWLDTAFDLPAVSRALAVGWRLPANWPKVLVTVLGEGENVRTRGGLEFPQPVQVELDDWNIPTNLVHDPLIGFSAVRGVSGLLKSLPLWREWKLETAPNQIFTWSQAGMPVLEYAAAAWPDASNVVRQLSPKLQNELNPWLASSTMGRLTNAAHFNGLVWENAPFITPQIRSYADQNGQFVFAGLIPIVRTNLPPPDDLLREVTSNTNWLGYAWEMTGPKLEQDLYISQLARLIFRKAQLPPESASLQWLKGAAPKLGNCVTVASRNGADRLSFTRKSSLGFDAVELHLLADWLESPQFPVGLHTTLAPGPPAAAFKAGAVR